MIHFTTYALQKFDILNTHKVFFTKEQVEEVLRLPDSVAPKGKYFVATKDGISVIYRIENNTKHIITFYPVSYRS
ncbi:hypothetical protein A2477_01920 [Candidatus Falkowbacteria bacterium RIFOXYC2_FULL_47_12]|uniref:DUF4258 domain-containing protein n=1 Tax=Candidatus Falkowbacteria bacterium RIFOXYC2_FULL_47_12 TaxID=1798004 RepID=A0A1F5TNL7_9BACT|nr:MAG: hypothetical protein A2477_01920 [Candidatus Falkowbacteria bacterium RIFOXYC2_FULL_47_12]